MLYAQTGTNITTFFCGQFPTPFLSLLDMSHLFSCEHWCVGGMQRRRPPPMHRGRQRCAMRHKHHVRHRVQVDGSKTVLGMGAVWIGQEGQVKDHAK